MALARVCAVTAYNPIFFDQLFLTLRKICFYCHHFRLGRIEMARFVGQLTLLRAGLGVEALALGDLDVDAAADDSDDDTATPTAKRKPKSKQQKVDSVASVVAEIERTVAATLETAEAQPRCTLSALTGARARIIKHFFAVAGTTRCRQCKVGPVSSA